MHVIAELEHWLTPFSAQLMSKRMSNSSCQACEKLIKILEGESLQTGADRCLACIVYVCVRRVEYKLLF